MRYPVECQIPCLPYIAEGKISFEPLPIKLQIKRRLARLWNRVIKKHLKKIQKKIARHHTQGHLLEMINQGQSSELKERLMADDWVRVRSKNEILATLDNWKELKGNAFLENMWQYCGTTQQVLISMTRFFDERDYTVKKCDGLILIKGVMCEGTPVFGRCDRRCHYFWREEWLEKIQPPEKQNILEFPVHT